MVDHTPGTWHWKRNQYSPSYAIQAHIIENDGGDIVATVSYLERPEHNNDFGEADTQLLAAAKDMLIALRDILWAVAGYGDFANDYPKEYAAAKAAIVKAEGI